MLEGRSHHLLVWALLGSEPVKEVVLVLLVEHLKSSFEVLLDEVSADFCHLLPLVVSLLSEVGRVVLEHPESGISEEWSKITPDGGKEVFVAKAKNLIYHVDHQDTKHPDLLVSDRAARSLIHSVLAESSHKLLLHVVNECLVEAHNTFFILGRDIIVALVLEEDWSKLVVVVLEEVGQLFEEGDSSARCLDEMSVS